MAFEFRVVDVHDPADGGAHAALVLVSAAEFGGPYRTASADLDHVEEYRPGRFYERELPPLLAVVAPHAPLEILVIDGTWTLIR